MLKQSLNDGDYMDQMSPFSTMFDSRYFRLEGERWYDESKLRWGSNQTKLNVYFDPYGKRVNLCVNAPNYVKKLDHMYTDQESLETALRSLESEYPDSFSSLDLLQTTGIFFKAIECVVFLHGDVTKPTYDNCSQCGSMVRDDFEFMYAPAVPGTPLNKASLELYWEYGCYGGDSYAGAFDDYAPVVLERLEFMLETAEGNLKAPLRRALKLVENKG